MTFLIDYVSNVRQASCISYVDVLHVILPFDVQYLTLASCVKRLHAACGCHSPIPEIIKSLDTLTLSGGSRGGMRGMHPPTGTSVAYFT